MRGSAFTPVDCISAINGIRSTATDILEALVVNKALEKILEGVSPGDFDWGYPYVDSDTVLHVVEDDRQIYTIKGFDLDLGVRVRINIEYPNDGDSFYTAFFDVTRDHHEVDGMITNYCDTNGGRIPPSISTNRFHHIDPPLETLDCDDPEGEDAHEGGTSHEVGAVSPQDSYGLDDPEAIAREEAGDVVRTERDEDD